MSISDIKIFKNWGTINRYLKINRDGLYYI